MPLSFAQLLRDRVEHGRIKLTKADSGWIPSDSAIIVEGMNALIKEYAIDRQRVVTHGMGVAAWQARWRRAKPCDKMRISGVPGRNFRLLLCVRRTRA